MTLRAGPGWFVCALVLAGAACRAGADPAPPSLPPSGAVIDEIRAAIGEASALVVLGEGRFLVADDARGVQLVDRGTVRVLAPMADCEGLTQVGDRFVAVEEGSGTVWGFALDGATTRLGALAHPPFAGKTKANKGWEGLAFLPASRAFDHKDHLVAVHEGRPKAVALFAWPALSLDITIVLSGALDQALADLSDVAVDPQNGELLLLSDESRRVARVRLLGGDVAVVRIDDLPIGGQEKPEGLAFDQAGSLWIVTDATGRLLRIALAPAAREQP